MSIHSHREATIPAYKNDLLPFAFGPISSTGFQDWRSAGRQRAFPKQRAAVPEKME
jgi:hypothetical protein